MATSPLISFNLMCSFKRWKRLPISTERKGGTDIFITSEEMDKDEPTEACIMESEKFKGATATFDEYGRIIQASPDLFPSKYSNGAPSFNPANREELNPASICGRQTYLQAYNQFATSVLWTRKDTPIPAPHFL